MNIDEILQGNKLIAKFMGEINAISDLYYLPNFGKYVNQYGIIDYVDTFRASELKYHSSWDWLMPVMRKIINGIGVRTVDECSDEEWFQSTRIAQMYIGIDIAIAHHYVVEFITWYNKYNSLNIK